MNSPRADVVLLCPRRSDHGWRDRLWSFSRSWWADLFPDWTIVEGHHETGPFSRSAAVNRAAEEAGSWEVAVVIDADVLPDREGVLEAVEVARTGRPASGFTGRKNLSEAGTRKVLSGFRGSWERLVVDSHPLCNSGALAVSRDLFDAVGGFDEAFVGWGFEDTAFEIALETVSGSTLHKAPPALWHLWHPRTPDRRPNSPTTRANRARRERYSEARGDRAALAVLLDEAREVKAGNRKILPAASARPTTIPRILHRTVPAETDPVVEQWWRAFADFHPGWDLRTHRDPLDPAEWETGDLWDRCSSGAQRAGLIRLEALYRWGGIYVDSDVEPYRPLDPLLGFEAFAAWEDRTTVPDAVLGARPGHPAFAMMLEKARAAILAGAGAWDSGPGVTTSTLPGRPDVLLLPPGSFYPYHYKEKHRSTEDHAHAQPWAFAAHHWHHSWAGR